MHCSICKGHTIFIKILFLRWGYLLKKNKTLTSFQKTNLQTNLHRKFRKKIYFRVAFSQGQVDAKWTGVYMFLKSLKENKHVNQLSRLNIL